MTHALTTKQTRFARLVFDGKSAIEAYRAAYDLGEAKESSFQSRAYALFRDERVKELVASMEKAAAESSVVTAAMVLDQWWKIATADPQEIITHRRICCRHCHGTDHRYRWIDEAEWAEAVGRVVDSNRAMSADRQAEIPDCDGGFGFNGTDSPHPECPRCFGDGFSDVHIADTRKLPRSSAARLLFNGVKKTRSGVEVLLRDRDAALTNIARHLGMFHDRALGAANGNPIELEVIRRVIVDPKGT